MSGWVCRCVCGSIGLTYSPTTNRPSFHRPHHTAPKPVKPKLPVLEDEMGDEDEMEEDELGIL